MQFKRTVKYRNKPVVTAEGERFDSIRERNRWTALLASQRAGYIHDLERQVRVKLYAFGPEGIAAPVKFASNRTAVHVVDFRYTDSSGNVIWEDAKGVDTPVGKLKRAMVEAQLGITIRLV